MAVNQRPTRTPKVKAPFKKGAWITPAELERYNAATAKKNSELKAQERILLNAKEDKAIAEDFRTAAYTDWQADPSDTNLYNTYVARGKDVAKQQTIIEKTTAKIKTLTTDLAAIKKKFAKDLHKGTGLNTGNSSSVKTTDATLKPPFAYKYNAPMVTRAYMSPQSPQALAAANPDLITSPGKFKNAANEAWKTTSDNGIAGAKGVIQMSSFLAQHTTITKDSKKQAFFDESMYGFKFLYNPNSVSMTWGINTEVNTQMESMGLDKSVPLTAGLYNSTISFELLLNRIEDMKYLDETGLKSQLFANILVGLSENPYPHQGIPDLEFRNIYKKGTMYDLDYLFRATSGFNSQYTSSLNGTTSDRGWLYALPVELHLGDGLHYLVRITNLSVNHTMFNERMVPVLSTVGITCTRYYDGPEQNYTGIVK